jgi:hypothetical protein
MRLFALFGLLLALLAVGCGSETTVSPEKDPTVSSEALTQAAERAKAVGTSRFAFTGEMRFEGERVSFDGEGVFDFKRSHARMSWDLSDLASDGDDIDREDLVAEVRILDDRAFIRMPFFAELLPEAKPWIEFESDTEDVDAASDQLMDATGGTDPSTVLSLIKAASSSGVTNEGTDEIRGVDTTHYSAEVDLAKAIDSSPKRDRPALRRSLRILKAADAETTVPVDVWVDQEGLARRVREAWPVVDDEEFEMTFDYFDFGIPVDVKTPAADQVMSEKEFDAMMETFE